MSSELFYICGGPITIKDSTALAWERPLKINGQIVCKDPQYELLQETKLLKGGGGVCITESLGQGLMRPLTLSLMSKLIDDFALWSIGKMFLGADIWDS